MKFAGVNIYGHPISILDQHSLTTKNFFYLEFRLEKSKIFDLLLAEQITIGLPAPPMQMDATMKKLLH
jgi:hypothetical protein